MSSGSQKVFVIGLDCGEPSLVFDRWRDELPNLRRLMDDGAYGLLESCHPPITVPAWTSMLSSKDPGQLGFYGFRNRADYSYENMRIATGNAIKVDRVWDVLGKAGKQCIMIGVPQTYPIRPVNGHLISSFLTPSTQGNYTYPNSLKQEIEALVGEYEVDVRQFRTEDKDYLLKQIYQMTDKHLQVIRYLLRNKPWDFFMWVEMGVDRIHHGFWKFHDPTHRKYEPGNPYENAIRDYYKYLDNAIGEILSLVPDNAAILVVSDHGAKGMDGGICINEWLVQNGWLVLKDRPEGVVTLEKCEIDWAKTRAWGSGGYYARVFLNVEGREPQGVIPQSEYEATRNELKAALEAIPDENGNPLPTVAHRPEDLYAEVRNIPPDLIVYFGDLRWRSVGSLGLDVIHTFENDTGPDDANHAQDGLIILHDPAHPGGGRQMEKRNLLDVAPTVLDLMGVPVPEDMRGTAVHSDDAAGYSDDEEALIEERLAALGYL